MHGSTHVYPRHRLADALGKRDYAQIEELLTKHRSLGGLVWEGYDTLMHFAADRNDLPLIEILHRLFPRMAQTMRDSQLTPFMLAAANAQPQTFELTFQLSNCDINLCSNLSTSLELAVNENTAQMVEKVVALGADPGYFHYGILRAIDQGQYAISPNLCTLFALNPRLPATRWGPTHYEKEVHARVAELLRLPEDDVAEIRFRVYFSRSLFDRLFFELGRPRGVHALKYPEAVR